MYPINSQMIRLPRDVTDQVLIDIVGVWVDALARQDYDAVAAALGYALAFGQQPADCIRQEISRYRHRAWFPGVVEFAVTDRTQASGGNPQPRKAVTRYQPNVAGLFGAIEYDLPLNGKWSDLCADFVLTQTDGASPYVVLSLEEIGFRRRQDGVG
ncbi:hypothetical protein R16034_01032 [Ralstonia edaphis]|uniref:Uncharacterized protein n=1 Tax=Ralstonia edaphi TaxID=3058599 RepID=A0AB72WY98_9RALS|nr:hypothetical protein R16034_01032 [Ralstonia sp. LMG 6871]